MILYYADSVHYAQAAWLSSRYTVSAVCVFMNVCTRKSRYSTGTVGTSMGTIRTSASSPKKKKKNKNGK